MKIKFLSTILVCLAMLVACEPQDGKGKSDSLAVAKEDAVAIVNGTTISKASMESLKQEISQRMRGQQFSDEQIMDELVNRHILVEEALKKKLDESPEFIASLKSVKDSLLSQAVLQEYFKNNEISDDELKAEYDKNTKPGDNLEFKARHILVKTEAEAVEIISKLDQGGDFVALAKESSTGPSGPNGGDLGWFSPKQMVPPFSNAVKVLENGKYTSAPVETSFGFHVILREESREQPMPDFETVKAKILPALHRQKMQEYMNNLREQATVEILLGKEAPELSEVVENAEAIVEENIPDEVEVGLPIEADAEIDHGHSHSEPAEAIADAVEEVTETVEAVDSAVTEMKELVTP